MSRQVLARYLLACCLLLALSACGNKGPLFLPEEEKLEEEVKKTETVDETE